MAKHFKETFSVLQKRSPSIIGRIWIWRLSQLQLGRPTMWESYIQTISQLVEWMKLSMYSDLFEEKIGCVLNFTFLQSGEKATSLPSRSKCLLRSLKKFILNWIQLITVGIVGGKVDTSDWGSYFALLSTKFNFT